ncbi:MAG: inorganic diphosphatase [Proteobacteria bacterium]|nr:inorganic diphosphatase [Candidatus Enterousia scatequi]
MNLYNLTPGAMPPQEMNAIIEIPEHTRVKYEIDKDTGLLKVRRVVNVPMVYPANYGYFPGTLAEDGDPLDCFVICSAEMYPGSLISVRPIGALAVEDQSGKDTKIICVPVNMVDSCYANILSVDDLPIVLKSKLEYFCQHYKDLQKNAWVKIIGWLDTGVMHQIIMNSIENYNKS